MENIIFERFRANLPFPECLFVLENLEKNEKAKKSFRAKKVLESRSGQVSGGGGHRTRSLIPSP